MSSGLSGFVQCDIRVPETLREQFGNLPPIVRTTNVCRYNVEPLKQKYVEREWLMTQSPRFLTSSFELTNSIIKTQLFFFYLELGYVCTKVYCFVQYTPTKCFNNVVQFAVNAHRQGDENSKRSVVAETMKLLAISSYGYQIMDRGRHSVTMFINVEKTHAAISKKMVKILEFINDQLEKVELAKSEIVNKKRISVGFFILQYANLRVLELFYNFFHKNLRFWPV